MKSGDLTVIQYHILKATKPYEPHDRKVHKIRTAHSALDSRLCDDPKIMFPVVYYTEPKWSVN